MQPQLTLKNGEVIPLSDEVYEIVVSIVQAHASMTGPAASLEMLEAEFADLFVGAGASTDDLLEEHRQELAREERRLNRLA